MVHSLDTSRQMKQIKGLELISGIELVFLSCLTGTTDIKSKEISEQVKETIIRLKKKSITEREREKKPSLVHLLKRQKVLMSFTTSKSLEDQGRELKWTIPETFPW